jgi:hypothetical protein
MSRGCGLPWAFSSRESLLVEIIRSSATSVRFFPDCSRSCRRAAAMLRRGPSGPVTLSGKIVSRYEAVSSGSGVEEPGMAANGLPWIPVTAGHAA